jgi:hypothetical protein
MSMDEANERDGYKDEIYSNAVRAGKRTYFFDIKSTKGGDLYLTVTESKKKYLEDGKFVFEKHKIFLYKEDFEKFMEGLDDAVKHIDKLKDSGEFTPPPSSNGTYKSDVSFDELD